MMGLTCIIIAGTLWLGDGESVYQPVVVKKEPQSDIVRVRPMNRQYYVYYEIDQQHQLRMGSEEWLADCINAGYTLPVQAGGEAPMFLPYDDIDDEERTGIND